MKSSCVCHPERECLVIIRKWQVEFCNGNQCAAAVLSFLEYWHNWKLDTDNYNLKSNDIAEAHGESRFHSEDTYQYHSLVEISDGILNLYGTKTISDAIKFLENKEVISIHRNPNPKYCYDKTNYFRFYPEICNNWLKNHYKSRSSRNHQADRQKYTIDSAKMQHRADKNVIPSSKNALPITEINNKEKNQSIKTGDNFLNDENKNLNVQEIKMIHIQPIIAALKEVGLSTKHFSYPDTLETLDRLCNAGATVDIFLKAYVLASKTSKNFGVNYLAKVVEDLLRKPKNTTAQNQKTKVVHIPNDKEDFKGGLEWMGDLVDYKKDE